MDRIGIPVEEAFWTIKGIKNIDVYGRADGCGLSIEFNQTADMDAAYLDVRDRIERVKPELPDDFRYAFISRFSESDEPILYFGITVTGNYDDPYRLVQEEVVEKLERIDGVAKVETWGGNAKTVQIQFLLDKLRQHKIDVNRLIGFLRSENFILSAGSLTDGGRELLIRIDAKLTDLESIENIPIKGLYVRLKDIAHVAYENPPRLWRQRINRREAIQIGVFKESGANSIELTSILGRVLDDISKNPDLSGLSFEVLFDQGKFIDNSLKDLEESGLWGGIFAIIVLFLFLRKFRMTLFISLAIPVSILVTITMLYFMGWSLNVITLSGLMICVGLVVDNAIVVVENIQSYKQRGLNNREASYRGANEVSLAITLATLTTAVVFLPLILMSGDRILTFFMLRVGVPVIFALLASLLAALVFIPLAINRFALRGAAKEPRVINNFSKKVGGLVDWSLKNREKSIVILLLVLSSISIPMKFVVSTDEEEGNINDFVLRFEFPVYYSMNEIDSTLSKIEDFLFQNKQKYDIKTVVTGFRRGYGRTRVFLNEHEEQIWLIHGIKRLLDSIGVIGGETLNRAEVVEDIKEKLKPPPGVEMFTSWRRGRGEEHAVRISLYGENTERLLQIADEVKRRLGEMEGVLSVETDVETGSEEIQFRYDRQLVAKYGINAATAAFGINSLIRGVRMPDIRLRGHEISMTASIIEEDREYLSQVMNLPLTTGDLQVIRLGDIADYQYGRGVGEINRKNRRTQLKLKINTTEENIHKLSKQINASMEGLSLPTGYEWSKGDRFESVEDATKDRSQAWLLAITFVFLLMGALFESFFLPLAVIFTIPFAFFGVWWILFLTGTQFGIMAGIGAVILIGVVVNNAIVLVDKVNRLRTAGMDRHSALINGAEQRFRPIAMTALTTIMGLIPMAAGGASFIGIPYSPMGRAIIGGMLAATVMTPVIVPLAYSIVEDLKNWFIGYFKSF